ncbi:MAG: hemerythrin domain-containing protein, partial [Cyclobacteriaceae bacterium]|nr:hemerythrin domain-containing protein [Cyclobacteriaceae bacterium]
EEFVLFPYIKNMVAEGHSSKPPFGSVENPISMMEFEHEKAGSVLKEIRDLSQNFTPPLHACNTYRVYYAKLQEFEEDLHFHIHLENNILFPKAIKMEAGQLV